MICYCFLSAVTDPTLQCTHWLAWISLIIFANFTSFRSMRPFLGGREKRSQIVFFYQSAQATKFLKPAFISRREIIVSSFVQDREKFFEYLWWRQDKRSVVWTVRVILTFWFSDRLFSIPKRYTLLLRWAGTYKVPEKNLDIFRVE